MTNRMTAVAAAVLILGAAGMLQALGHCQIPCGIYDDAARFTSMREHVTTIEKSMRKIQELAAADKPDVNQQVRWVTNKDQHADALTEIVTYYFLAQRVKAPADGATAAGQKKYAGELASLHGIIVHSMKAKQTLDTGHCDTLRALINAFEHSYLGAHAGHTH